MEEAKEEIEDKKPHRYLKPVRFNKQEIVNEELTQKAYQLLIDKIDVDTFEKYLYELVEISQFNSKTLIFDFVNINYKLGNYKKPLFNLLECYCSDEELLSFKIYFSCLNLLSSDTDKFILELISDLSSLWVQNDYELDMLHEFYMLNISMPSSFGDDYYHLSEAEGIAKAIMYSKEVILKFNFFKKSHDWKGFLKCIIEKEEEHKNNIIKTKYTSIEQSKSLSNKIIDLLKGILGLI
ncbi:hypothetical protein CXF68_16540 [Tenacibaculum sp. Bg11-29]|uniref:hypothetical protein n=1 Tax=Tenacibaculum sp. Bg11-29 TaxID=2058306 RepID=UPI000C32E505|nr:hypothetical protein [Tenacibaculum sp. Bg11-29]PKH52200.1 hypothetical protein CXF68_16540 [Tenacibaculum sp. Bg11-29]